MANEKTIEQQLNELISEAVKGGGFVYVVDNKDNDFILRLTKPVRIQFYPGYKGETYES